QIGANVPPSRQRNACFVKVWPTGIEFFKTPRDVSSGSATIVGVLRTAFKKSRVPSRQCSQDSDHGILESAVGHTLAKHSQETAARSGGTFLSSGRREISDGFGRRGGL